MNAKNNKESGKTPRPPRPTRENKDNRVKPTFNSLDELFNFSRKRRGLIAATSPRDYQAEIRKMNLADLQAHAITLSLRPSRNRAMLEKTLMNNFVKHRASLVSIKEENGPIKNQQRVLEILSKGS